KRRGLTWMLGGQNDKDFRGCDGLAIHCAVGMVDGTTKKVEESWR
ncbi:hypothetical protein NPIL_137171, partial [Nephila pilipes]